jgi:hypothetical protein
MGNSLSSDQINIIAWLVATFAHKIFPSGYTNLIDHVTSQHADDYVEIMEAYRSNEKESGPLDSFLS